LSLAHFALQGLAAALYISEYPRQAAAERRAGRGFAQQKRLHTRGGFRRFMPLPLIDYHVHLKGGLTLEQAWKSRMPESFQHR
jgi:hypothetical protein